MTINRYTVGAWSLLALFIGLLTFLDHRQDVREQNAARAHWEEEWLYAVARSRCGDFIPDESSTLGDVLLDMDCGTDLLAAIREVCAAERERWLKRIATDDSIEYHDCIVLHVDIELPPYDLSARHPGVDINKPLSSLKPSSEEN